MQKVQVSFQTTNSSGRVHRHILAALPAPKSLTIIALTSGLIVCSFLEQTGSSRYSARSSLSRSFQQPSDYRTSGHGWQRTVGSRQQEGVHEHKKRYEKYDPTAADLTKRVENRIAECLISRLLSVLLQMYKTNALYGCCRHCQNSRYSTVYLVYAESNHPWCCV